MTPLEVFGEPPAFMTLEEGRARELTEEVKIQAEELWRNMLHLYVGRAHIALGYRSWAEYCAAEFDLGKSRAYQMLNAARVLETIPESANVERPRSEAVARELVPVLRDEPERVPEVWAEVVGEHGPTPTAAQVRERVQEGETQVIKPQRKPLPDGFRGATYDLGRVVKRITRLTLDDRFSRHIETVTDVCFHDLVRAHDDLQTVIDAMTQTSKRGRR